MQDLAAGQVDLDIDDPTNALPLIRAGVIRAYAVTAKARLTQAPEIPTVDEAGLPGFYYSRWHGLLAPKGTPREIIATLNAAARAALADANVRARPAGHGAGGIPARAADARGQGTQQAEIAKWWPIIKAAGHQAGIRRHCQRSAIARAARERAPQMRFVLRSCCVRSASGNARMSGTFSMFRIMSIKRAC